LEPSQMTRLSSFDLALMGSRDLALAGGGN
jgi:hypothetical protein